MYNEEIIFFIPQAALEMMLGLGYAAGPAIGGMLYTVSCCYHCVWCKQTNKLFVYITCLLTYLFTKVFVY